MKILVPYAGSRYSLGVLRLVAKMALNPGSEILILNVVAPSTGGIAFVDDHEKALYQQRVLTQKSRHLSDISSELAFWQKDCRVDYRVYFGAPKTSILEVAEEWKADMVVIGANDRSKFGKMIYGSVTKYVIENAPCSVMIVKPTPEVAEGTIGEDGFRVLVPIEGSVYSYETISWLANQAWRPGSKFRLLMAVPAFNDLVEGLPTDTDQAYLQEQWHSLKERAFLMLEEHALNLGKAVGNENVSIDVEPGEPRDAILAVADTWKPDMIAMGSEAPKRLNKLFVDSVPTFVREHCDCTVVIVRRFNGTTPPRSHRGNLQQLSEILESINFVEPENEGRTPHGVGTPH